ncbi:MAG: hypothetical protein ACK4ST_15780, partial [Elioraea tepidiphila]
MSEAKRQATVRAFLALSRPWFARRRTQAGILLLLALTSVVVFGGAAAQEEAAGVLVTGDWLE